MGRCKRMMKFGITAILLASMGFAWSETAILSEADRAAMLDKLKTLQEGAGSRAEKRAGTALSSFKAAASSDDRVHEFYVNCVEKARFKDEKKSSQDFRLWKRRHNERQDSPEFRRALRHQLNWLILSMEAKAASSESEVVSICNKATGCIDAIVEDQGVLKGKLGHLEGDVGNSVFAVVYGVSVDEEWPKSPLNLKEIYEKVILPPFLSQKNVEGVRAAWKKWITQEALVLELKQESPGKGERSGAFERFLAEERPQMLWDLETTVFGMGEERAASQGMLAHLQEFQGHKNEVDWTKEFVSLLSPEEE